MQTIAYWAVVFALWSVGVVPRWVGYYRARGYALFLDLCIPRWRKIAIRNLELAGFPHPKQIVDGLYRSMARLMLAFARLPKMSPENIGEWIEYDGLENFTRAEARGKGVLVATAHLGNWELSAFAHAWMHKPMHVVVRPLDNPRIDQLVRERRKLSGNHIIDKKNAAREILRALHAGDAVGILIDQNSSLDEGVFVDFFGHKACANAAFVKLAHKTGAAVVPGYAVWNEARHKYILRFDPEISITGDVQADTQKVHSHLEQVIRKHPEQWLWIHRRWKTRPPGEPSLY